VKRGSFSNKPSELHPPLVALLMASNLVDGIVRGEKAQYGPRSPPGLQAGHRRRAGVPGCQLVCRPQDYRFENRLWFSCH
jgi:hypothetical protein